ncbi:pyrophosphate--fructose 6-phosphate 1-phosphotransferase [Dissulfurispira thermophila]|uniref:Pyrophosphate--fructose 6-phosphate 1-phosphotransferase n=2 Tax=root TaxID=1 RepID=A0A7G1GXX8_9BACT|nr:diphosphate--fructose-6-phosphate 1-phosphotransferase [Dissulfurispira thermophila]BCB95235.1 pyrophosphate--fructose 6-phosphate 1-phosphotransferase [Dissulfurispira thermophila]
MRASKAKGVVGIIVGGGPAPGINGVISSATIEAINEGKDVIGIKGGFKSLFNGDRSAAIPLTIDDVSRIHTLGGSILRTSRDYPDKVKERFKTLITTLKQLRIKHLITIGGEGTLFMANWIEKEARGSINVVHVPKTIDNDIPLPGGASTFGYETARHWGVEIIKNIMEDAKTMGRWYFVTTMGRHAGHLALGMGKAAGATITLISEEFEERLSIKKVADILAGSIIKRLTMGRDHGVAVLAEGIAEKFDIEELSQYEQLEKDETGRIRLSEIQLGRVLKHLVKKTLDSLGIKITIVDKNIGYELRAADPIPYDIEYTRDLGYGAVRYILRGGTGSMITFFEGHLRPVPFVEVMDYSTGKVKVRKVDISSEAYEVGRKYMIRLEKEDFEGENLKLLAKTVHLKPDDFKKRFSYLTKSAACR